MGRGCMIFAIAWRSTRCFAGTARGVDVERHLPTLATYLGHGHVTDTYWYLTATPELLERAMLRLEQPDPGALP